MSSSHKSEFKHSNCEIDDNVLAYLSQELNIPLATHDKELAKRVRKPFIVSEDMLRLMKYTSMTLLQHNSKWQLIPNAGRARAS